MKRINTNKLIGRKINRWTVLNEAKQRGRFRYLKCVCICTKIRVVQMNNLLSGKSKSCGCLGKEILKKKSTIHGLSKSPEYFAWQVMKARCKHSENYKKIKVYYRWKHERGFLAFYAYLKTTIGLKPKPYSAYSLDRIENKGHYVPGNVRWATRPQQNSNRRKRRNTSSKFRFVYKVGNKWRAYIDSKGIKKHIGYFASEQEANKAVKKTIKKEKYDL